MCKMLDAQVLITEPISKAGLDLLSSRCRVDVRSLLSPQELAACIGPYDALIVRSKTRVTSSVIEAASHLRVIGRAGTGVDNIDIDAATVRGIVVVNAPTSNTIAVAEHTFGLMLNLARHIAEANAAMHAGAWVKKRFMGHELRGKTLGLIGFGRVGTAVARRAQAFEMRVIAYDPFIAPQKAERMGVQLVTLDDLLAQADFVSLHVPLTDRTRGMIGARELSLMKPSAFLVNTARGGLVVEQDLLRALCDGTLAGAALDVLEAEPAIDPQLCACPNLLLTPHLGASTQEAQDQAAIQVAQQVLDVLCERPPAHPVNVVGISAHERAFLAPFLDLVHRMGKFYAQYFKDNLGLVELTYAGEIADHATELLTSTLLSTLLGWGSGGPVTPVNARLVATERGLVVREVRTSEASPNLITLRTETTREHKEISGTVVRGEPHIVRLEGFWLEFPLKGLLLVSEHIEQPGIIGEMGTLLGRAGINISFVQVGRKDRGGPGVMVLGLDEPIPDDVLKSLMRLRSIRSATVIDLR